MAKPDVTIAREGMSLILFNMHTPEIRAWVSENVTIESWQWMGTRFAVDIRPARDLVDTMREAGFTVEDEK